jgi:exosome complex component RRP4
MASAAAQSIVVPGQVITTEGGYIRGHGTYMQASESEEGEPVLIASVAGVVERVNKLISVRPIHSRFIAEVGDLVVGRITTVGSKHWKVDLGAHKDAVLALSSVNLPGGAQRIRTADDQLQMRTFYQEHDLISAEVQNVGADGGISLHTRSLKYGKLENGLLLQVPQVLIRRLKQHTVTLPAPIGVALILGTNGSVWITRALPDEWSSEDTSGDLHSLTPRAEQLMQLRKLHAETPILREERERICRVRNAAAALRHCSALLTPEAIVAVYNRSLSAGMPVQDMIKSESIISLVHPDAAQS